MKQWIVFKDKESHKLFAIEDPHTGLEVELRKKGYFVFGSMAFNKAVDAINYVEIMLAY